MNAQQKIALTGVGIKDLFPCVRASSAHDVFLGIEGSDLSRKVGENMSCTSHLITSLFLGVPDKTLFVKDNQSGFVVAVSVTLSPSGSFVVTV